MLHTLSRLEPCLVRFMRMFVIVVTGLFVCDSTDVVARSDDPASDAKIAESEQQYQEFQKQIELLPPHDVPAIVLKFHSEHPKHPRLQDVEQVIQKLPQTAWLKRAMNELEKASPDDPGFVEGWLPVAQAWQSFENDAEARDALRQANKALPRITRADRGVQSAIELCQQKGFDANGSEQLITDAATMCEQISDRFDRAESLADLSGLAAKFGHPQLATTLLEKAIDSTGWKNFHFISSNKVEFVWKSRAVAWTRPSDAIEPICVEARGRHLIPNVVMTQCFAHAALAAVRQNNSDAFTRLMIQAEAALSMTNVRSYPYYTHAARLAEVYMAAERWQNVAIIANNITDPRIRASILFHLMHFAPQFADSPDMAKLFESYGQQRWATLGLASYVSYRLQQGDNRLTLLDWTQQLPHASLRAAADVGFARATNLPTARPTPPVVLEANLANVNLTNSRSLMEAAEQRARQNDDPYHAALAWIHIAQTWHNLDNIPAYRRAVAHVDDQCLELWKTVWAVRPTPTKSSYNDSYIDNSRRHLDNEHAIVKRITTIQRFLVQMQAKAGDAQGAMQTCLNLINSAGFISGENGNYYWCFTQMQAAAARLSDTTGIAPELIMGTTYRDEAYYRALRSAWSDDVSKLKLAIAELTKRSNHGELAHAYAELAILHARNGELNEYRAARRAALDQITRKKAPANMKTILATADAYAGEFALAETTIEFADISFFGDESRPRSIVAIKLANAGEWNDSIQQAKKSNKRGPQYHCDVWNAIAQARYVDPKSDQTKMLEWIGTIESQLHQTGALCGLAQAVQSTQPK